MAVPRPHDPTAGVGERHPRCCDWPMWPHLDLDLFVCLLCGRQLTRCRWVDPGLILADGGLGR
jgi:hypothetical protein